MVIILILDLLIEPLLYLMLMTLVSLPTAEFELTVVPVGRCEVIEVADAKVIAYQEGL